MFPHLGRIEELIWLKRFQSRLQQGHSVAVSCTHVGQRGARTKDPEDADAMLSTVLPNMKHLAKAKPAEDSEILPVLACQVHTNPKTMKELPASWMYSIRHHEVWCIGQCFCSLVPIYGSLFFEGSFFRDKDEA